jgi:hypothetical protein
MTIAADTTGATPIAPSPAHTRTSRGVPTRMLDALSSVRLGVTLLVILFVYSTIGSAGILFPVEPNILDPSSWRHSMVRTWPIFEMTEFEWFHTWFFLLNCALIGLNLTVATIRRIPFRVVNLGVWMIHTGIIVLLIGSVVYFGTKTEGDAPVLRRMVSVSFPDGQSVTLPALPSRSIEAPRPDGVYRFSIASIDPEWPLPTEEGSERRTAFSVTVACDTPNRSFMRRLLSDRPDLTEDLIPGEGRAVELERFGSRITDDRFRLGLDPAPQDSFWVKDSFALAVRPAGGSAWSQRVLEGMPRYNDRIRSVDEAWPGMAGGDPADAVRPLGVEARPPAGGDALGDVSARVIGYLRYARLEPRVVPGGDGFNPTVSVRLVDPSGRARSTRLAMSPSSARRGFDGNIAFRYAADEAELERLREVRRPSLVAEAGGASVRIDLEDPAAADRPVPVGDTGWTVAVSDLVRDLAIGDEVVSLAILEITSPEGETFSRWSFEDDALNRDITGSASDPHGGSTQGPPDERIRTLFSPGAGAPVVVVAGPGAGEGALVWISGMPERRAAIGEPIAFGGGAGLTVDDFSVTSRVEVRPLIWPLHLRDKQSADALAFAMAQVELVSPGGWVHRQWLPFHKYTFERDDIAGAGLGRWSPTPVVLPSGETVELLFTRERRPLPDPVILQDFHLTSYVGGYSGQSLSVRDWASDLRFGREGGWGDIQTIATNEPTEHEGLRFFQAYWDAPAPGSPGMAFTGLGVGNRRGVEIQLIGSTLSVIGMIYAFYVKPIIKRRRRERVLRELAAP